MVKKPLNTEESEEVLILLTTTVTQKILLLYMAAPTGKIIYKVAFISLKKEKNKGVFIL